MLFIDDIFSGDFAGDNFDWQFIPLNWQNFLKCLYVPM